MTTDVIVTVTTEVIVTVTTKDPSTGIAAVSAEEGAMAVIGGEEEVAGMEVMEEVTGMEVIEEVTGMEVIEEVTGMEVVAGIAVVAGMEVIEVGTLGCLVVATVITTFLIATSLHEGGVRMFPPQVGVATLVSEWAYGGHGINGIVVVRVILFNLLSDFDDEFSWDEFEDMKS